jgi:uncharacterized protein
MRKLMVVLTRFLLICATGLSFTSSVLAASFDCSKARTLVEQFICQGFKGDKNKLLIIL